jgi:hypothetical protein
LHEFYHGKCSISSTDNENILSNWKSVALPVDLHDHQLNFTWKERDATSTWDYLAISTSNSISILKVFHEKGFEEDGIMAIATNAAIAARSINADTTASGGERGVSPATYFGEEFQKIPKPLLYPVWNVIMEIEYSEIVSWMTWIDPRQSADHEGNSTTTHTTNYLPFRFHWINAYLDHVAMLTDTSSTPIAPALSTSSAPSKESRIVLSSTRKARKYEKSYYGMFRA